ncbi:MAG: Gldg family protein [Vicinamibacterales bacterium]|nr:Gldg family protein [Vicinamibacterales bacterium]
MTNRILSLVGWLGAALVFIGAAIRFGYPAKEQYVPYLVWTGLAAVVVYMAGQWREIAHVFRGRQARYGTLATFSVIVVLGILIAVNYIGARENKRWDLTANKAFSLSEQTRNVLTKLDAPLQVMVFAQEPDFPRYQDKLKEYEYVSKQVKAEYLDPDKKPTIAKQNQVQQYGTIVFNYKGRSERVTSDAEQDITNGIIKVVTGQQKKVYFVQGHGERDTTSSERDGYNAIAGALGGENYTVDKLVLAQAGSVPDDAAVVIVAGPKTDFFPPEIAALRKYLDKAGKLLLELDPPNEADSPQATNLIALAHDWGMDIGNDIVVDASGMGRLIGTDASVPVVGTYGSHPITEHFSFVTAFPLARSVTPVMGGVNGHTSRPFAQTSAQSWAEADVKDMLATGKVTLDESKGDKKGPVTIAAAASAASAASTSPGAPGSGSNPLDPEAPKPETRVAVVGDSDFAANAGLGIQGNRDLFMNTVGWLSQQENLIAIRPKNPEDRRITLTATQQSNITLLALLVIPACIFGSGVYAWSRRR